MNEPILIDPNEDLITFDDLKIENNMEIGPMAKEAKEIFDNGYGVLIEQNRRTLGNRSKLWQVTLIDSEWEEIVENSKISKDGVWEYCGEDEINEILKLIQTEL
tara:strand:+ start:143 stop:454 length:312 start_codon:yes stop_codon:yes gene_type:complete